MRAHRKKFCPAFVSSGANSFTGHEEQKLVEYVANFMFAHIVLVTLFSLIALAGCNSGEPDKTSNSQPKSETAAQSSIPPPGADELVIVATNDFHASLQKAEGLASVIRSLRKQYKDRMVYLDGGDQFQGSLEGNMNKGEAVVQYFNLLGLDAAALGNHELDYGPDVPKRVTVKPGEDGMGNLKVQLGKAKYPMLASNLIYQPSVSCQPGPYCNALGQKTVFQPRAEIERGGDKICVVGGTTPATANITNPDFIKGERFEQLTPVLAAEIQRFKLQGNCDWLILNVHEGLRHESNGKAFKTTALLSVLNGLPAGAVDAVIAGHSHIRVQEVVNGMPVMQTGTGAQVVGVLHLFKKNGYVSHRYDPFIPVPDTAVAFDVTSMLEPYRQKAFQFKRQVVASTQSPFPQDKAAESALGNLMADAVLAAGKKQAGAQFALMNGGGIRSSLPQGKITYDHIFRLMPFNNNLVVVELTGAELRRLLSIAFNGVVGMPSVSGLHVTTRSVRLGEHGPWERDLNGDGKKEDWERDLIVQVTDEQGRPLQDNQIYKLATNSFLEEGGDYQDVVYDSIPSARVHGSQTLIRDILADYFKQNSPLVPAQYYSKDSARIKILS